MATIEDMNGQMSAYLDKTALEAEPKPEFPFSVGWCSGYDNLIEARVESTVDAYNLADEALRSGRVILSARGGGAKTVLMHRIARKIVKDGKAVVIVDLKRWTQRLSEIWTDLSDPSSRLNLLLSTISFPQTSAFSLNSLPLNIERLIIVDGLNEVTTDTGTEMIDVFDDFVRFSANTGVIITDRLARRNLRQPERWRLATVMPLTNAEIDKVAAEAGKPIAEGELHADERELLSTPYFLDSRLNGSLGRNSSSVIHEYFKTNVSLTETEIDTVSAAAYGVYSKFQSRTFVLKDFAKDIGETTLKKLIDARAILPDNKRAYFAHHLKHDYLVSRYLATHDDLWNRNVLNIVTFGESSFEILAMTLQQVKTIKGSRRFL